VTNTPLSDLLGPDKPEWATPSDEQILSVLCSGLILSPTVIAENTDIHRCTVSNRLGALRASGLVEKLNRGIYRLAVSPEDSELPCEFIRAARLQDDLVEDGGLE
jgi:DNA-binding transcriptional ArsR family regulator